MMDQFIDYALIFAGTLFLLRLFAHLAVRIGLVDYPGRRKRHRGEIPLIGGPAVFASLAFGALFTVDSLYAYRPLFAALAVLLIAGLLDDLRDLTPRQKFLAQLVAGAIMVWWGQHTVTNLGDLVDVDNISTGYLAVPFTLIALLGLINAINMIDGIDGLAAGLSLIAFGFLAVCALQTGQAVSAQVLLTTVAVLLAFWAMNMRFPWQPHAKVFLGDSGSMILGGLLTWFSVELTRSPGGIYPMTAVWFLAIPLIDMGVIIARRLARGHSPFRAGRDHLHHMLIGAGMSPGVAVVCVLSAGVVLATAGFCGWWSQVPEYYLFYGFLALLALSTLISWRWRRIALYLRRRQRRQGARSAI